MTTDPLRNSERRLTVRQLEDATHALYAGGPWGKFHEFVNEGAHAITDAHSMSVYRDMVRTVWDAVQSAAEPVECGNEVFTIRCTQPRGHEGSCPGRSDPNIDGDLTNEAFGV